MLITLSYIIEQIGVNLEMLNKDIVYAITSRLNGKVLVGVTQRDGEKRLEEHKLDLKKGRERNKSLQRDYSESGEYSFSFDVIIETDEGDSCETVLIELLSRFGLAYNKRRGKDIEKYIKGEKVVPDKVYKEIEIYIHKYQWNKIHYKEMLNELQDIKTRFTCKSKDIYNRDFKNQSLTRYGHSTQRVVQVLFRNSCKFEEMWNKDLYDFTFEEAEEFLCSLKAKSLRSIQNIISKLHKYLEFAMEQGVSRNEKNYYKGLGRKENASKYLLF